MALGHVPRLLKENTMAIFEQRRHPFDKAFAIARGRLVEYGYLGADSAEGDTARIKLTPKGQKRDREMKRRGRAREIAFDRLFGQAMGAN